MAVSAREITTKYYLNTKLCCNCFTVYTVF
jgi:hypothetical protein